MKKFVLLFLVLFATWLSGMGATPAIVPEGQFAIFIKCSDTPNLYVWNNGDINGGWPGSPVTTVCTGTSGTNYYYYVVPKGYSSVNCIINYNGNTDQTANLEDITKNTYFEYNGTKNEKPEAKVVPSDIIIETSGETETDYPDIYLRGSFSNNFDAQEKYKFTRVDEVYSLTIDSSNSIPSGSTFKIADNNWGPFNYGGSTIKIDKSGTYSLSKGSEENCTFTVGIDGATISFNYSDLFNNSLPVKFDITSTLGGNTGGGETESEADYYVYFEKPSSWAKVYVWAWNDNANCTAAGDGNWPGDEMELRNGKYYWELPAGKQVPTYIIFSNENETKAGDDDLYFINKATYDLNANYTTADGKSGNAKKSGGNIPGGGDDGGGGTLTGSRMEGIQPTGTLPILYINVYDDNGGYDDGIIDYNLQHKNYFSNASYYLTVPEGSSFKALGSADAPLPLEIKARGNHTRTGYVKKPFKLKLGSKQGMLGLTKSKHFALLAHADDDQGFLRNFVGFSMGRKIGLPWTPDQQPVELVINGDYRGLYFLTESIRVEENRVNITELGDEVSSPNNITGGYLVELDNYGTDPNTIKIVDDYLMITPDTPEVYSADQKQFIIDQFTTMNNLVSRQSTDLWKYMDLDDAARYYIVEELVGHWESYHGSTYLFRDQVASKSDDPGKWHFSPLWDFGHAFGVGENNSITDRNGVRDGGFHYGNTWIGDMRNQQKFQDKVKATWQWFMSEGLFTQLMNDIDAHTQLIKSAAAKDHQRWPSNLLPNSYYVPETGWPNAPTSVVDNTNIDNKASSVKRYLRNRVNNFKNWNYFGEYEGNYPEPARDDTPSAELPSSVFPPEPEPFVDHTIPCHWATPRIYVNNAAKWENVNIWLYAESKFSAEWPGFNMLDSQSDVTTGRLDGIYKLENVNLSDLSYFEVPEGFENGYIIFSNNGKSQYPAAQQAGVAINGTSHIFNTSTNAWTALYPYSGTLPVLTIETAETDKLNGGKKATMNYTLDVSFSNDENLTACASSADNVDTIKLRGTSSYDENGNVVAQPSYKVKLDSKAGWCGMAASKHFVLMPWVDTKDNYALLNNLVGHELSRQIGLTWTPNQYPVELMLNGEYKGLYFVVENVRPSENRVPIPDAGDDGYNNAEDWIVEVDNSLSEEDSNYVWKSFDNNTYYFEATNPEYDDWNTKDVGMGQKIGEEAVQELFDAKIKELAFGVELAYMNSYEFAYENIIDRQQAIKYCIVQEIMDDANAFNKSMFLYHSTGSKWMFGPVWDFSQSFSSAENGKQTLIQNHDKVDENSDKVALMDHLYMNQFFRNALIREYWSFVHGQKLEIETSDDIVYRAARRRLADEEAEPAAERPDPYTSADNYKNVMPNVTAEAQLYKAALAKDAVAYGKDTPDLDAALQNVSSILASNISYLDTEWSNPKDDLLTSVGNIEADNWDVNSPVEYFDLFGHRVTNPSDKGIYILRQGNVTRKVIVK